jgi:hypothetical protein
MCKIPLESWASLCVKKAPHGAELCNRKKKKKGEKEREREREREREIRPPVSLAWVEYVPLRSVHMPLVPGLFSSPIVLS